MGIHVKIREAIHHISLEPVFFLFCVSNGLIRISTQALYLDKACLVNLNYPEEICENINNHTQMHKETQKLVSEIQAYNGMLQSAPAIIFTLFAGPLSDTYGRKSLILFSLFGFFILNFVFLINSFWFNELQAEYLLFECLQDLTGGCICFYLACYSYMVDITTPSTRTRRLSILDSAMPVGYIVGLPLGTFIKNSLGYVVLYSISTTVVFLAMVYVVFVVRDNRKQMVAEGTNTEKPPVLGCNKDLFSTLCTIMTSGIETINKKRPDGARRWIICFLLVFCLSKGIDSGSNALSYMFYRLQYKISDTVQSSLSTISTVLMFVCQIAVVPFLSGFLKWRDTAILTTAVVCNIIGLVMVAFNTKIWVLYIVYIFWMLNNTITTTSRSNLSKLMESAEIGKAFSVLGIIQALLPLATKPAFSFLYKATLETCPGIYMLLSASLYSLVVGLLIFTHFGLKKLDEKGSVPGNEELEKLNTDN